MAEKRDREETNLPEAKKAKKELDMSELRASGLQGERERGIVAFLGPEEEWFAGIVKKRFEDFLVFEVDLEGRVVRLTNKEPLNVSRLDAEGQTIALDKGAGFDQIAALLGEEKAAALRFVAFYRPSYVPNNLLSV